MAKRIFVAGMERYRLGLGQETGVFRAMQAAGVMATSRQVELIDRAAQKKRLAALHVAEAELITTVEYIEPDTDLEKTPSEALPHLIDALEEGNAIPEPELINV